MGFLGILKGFGFSLFVTILLALALHIVPAIRSLRAGKRVTLYACFLIFGFLGGLYFANAVLDEYIEGKYRNLMLEPKDSTSFSYLAGDFVPAKKMIGGQIKPHIREFLESKATQGTPEEQSLARKALGQST